MSAPLLASLCKLSGAVAREVISREANDCQPVKGSAGIGGLRQACCATPVQILAPRNGDGTATPGVIHETVECKDMNLEQRGTFARGNIVCAEGNPSILPPYGTRAESVCHRG